MPSLSREGLSADTNCSRSTMAAGNTGNSSKENSQLGLFVYLTGQG
eukprot:CAMPEP_0114276184 /NCGR_PEP_ID=MMETSP0059-20121206/101_1 /TAXON_ID=36894 /ORGANISM="Pyramimonas parkeae, Strain CCMP726" /LENGTH=45 /DNA_ID= /DNA_START= /DNA_END= /DNA_ORIENTATION=